ncbi:cyclic nucleotide-binding domain-containing protein [Bacillus sp. ISL-18]|uniref:Crp/Fnr family transcriptional regulator n=1 Tax=Bacillus sp. ISL-18 TaxID=2819118 RepID=UPI001BE5459A|nr:cyclic nucleotide-binding domain-containing protein [Bacillus sp. ISL-18]MBT2654965.1 cyclic nucleotide-binding domain-containing protein [Bacillus sp. ISL-18]
MREIIDGGKLDSYIQMHQMDRIFTEQLLQHITLYCFDKGELICSQGEPAQYLYILVEGKIKIYTNSAEGKTLILSFKTPLEVIGDLEYVQSIDFINTVEAVSPVMMIGVQHRWLRQFGHDHAPLLNFLLEIITKKFHLKNKSMSFNIMYPVEVRLASYLLSISFEESELVTSIKDAANLIGTSYRHLNRVITKFCNQGLIERHRGFILVKDIEGLRKLAGDNIYE